MKYCTIEVYSHTLRITDVETPIIEAIRKIARNNIQHTLKKQRGRWIREGTKTFAARTFDDTEFRFHRHQLDEVLTSLEYSGFGPNKVDVKYMPLYEPEDIDVTMDSKFIVRDNQAPLIDYVVSDGATKVLTLQTGQGKSQPLSSKVKVPGGWSTMGEMKVGTTVTAADGTPCKVIGVYPQGTEDVYRVTLRDGRSTICSGEHLWKVKQKDIEKVVMLKNINYLNVTTYIPVLCGKGVLAWERLIDISYEGKMETQCIAIDHPDRLYVTDDFIVTHNTFCGLKAAELISKRLMIVVPAKYLDKWIGDVEEAYNLDRGKILVVQGQKALIALLDLYSREPISFDVVIVTSTTFQDYFKNYENSAFYNLPGFYLRPEKIFEFLGIGFRIIDETHQFFHLNFKMDLYTHIPKALYLSATLVPDDKFTERMYQISYPKHLRMDGGAYVRYTHVNALHYRIKDYTKVRYTGGQGQYSHIVFEQWLMKHPKAMANYLEMIWKQVKFHFIDRQVSGQKCLIFAGMVEMCEIIRDYIDDKTNDFVVSKYNAEDDYEVLLGSDITVSTLGSAGTAVDIKNLLFCMMTVGLSGSQPNLQALGRLRELRNYPGQNPHFMYFVCSDIGKHVEYHDKKKQLFKGRVLTHKTLYYEEAI